MAHERYPEKEVYVGDQHNGRERSIGDLFANLTQDTRLLMIQELALAKSEIGQKVSQASSGATYLAMGGAIAYAGFLALLAAAILGLALIMPGWLAALIVGLIVAIIGYALVQKGMSTLKPKDLKPQQTIESVKETKEWAKEQI